MTAVVIHESMFGATRRVAEAIGRGISQQREVLVVPIGDVTPELIGSADLVVVGGPTHLHSLSRPTSRKAAVEAANKPDSGITLEKGAGGPGLREWLPTVSAAGTLVAAFDTRMHGPQFFTGRASRRINRSLRRHGAHPVCAPESFLVAKDNTLDPGELERAHDWGVELAQAVRQRSDRV